MEPNPPSRTHNLDAGFSLTYTHRLRFTRDTFAPENATLIQALKPHGIEDSFPPPPLASHNPARVLFFIDDNLPAGLPNRIREYAATHRSSIEIAGPIHTVPGGEQCKNDRAVFDTVCSYIHDARLCRHSYVVVIGGGAVLDAVGFTASISHRGVRVIRMPSTTLAQADVGVGVKNGINAFGKKNYHGTFSPPWAVINDEQLLHTLSNRDWRCGFSEAVKVSLMKDPQLFERIVGCIPLLLQRDMPAAMPVINRSAELHLHHITDGQDPFETASGRPLDFGHWAAHKLEQLSDYRLRHGEAVAIGIAIDVTYSALMGLLPWTEAQKITTALTSLGFSLFDDAMHDGPQLLEGLDEFREHLGGPLTITLLTGIGKPIDVHEIDRTMILAAVEQQVSEPAFAEGQ